MTMEHKKMDSDSSHPSGDDSVARFGSEVPARPTSPAEVAHTPGVWILDIQRDSGGWKFNTLRVQISTDEKLIADFDTSYCEYPHSDAEIEANARLMAAAPELLAALRGLLAEAHGASKGLHTHSEWSLIARAAIERATGATA